MVTHLFLTGWMLHIPSSLCYLLCSGCHEKEVSYFNLLQIRWVMRTSMTHVCYFSGSSLILVPCNCSWLGCFCCSFQGPWGLNQGTTFLVQGFLSWAFSWCHNVGSGSLDIKKKVCVLPHDRIFESRLVAVFKTAGVSLGFCFQRVLLLWATNLRPWAFQMVLSLKLLVIEFYHMPDNNQRCSRVIQWISHLVLFSFKSIFFSFP